MSYIGLIILITTIGLSINTAPPLITSVDGLVAYSKCDPARISYGMDKSMAYKRVNDWESPDFCLARGYSDCKCHAVVAEAALTKCGYWAKVQVLNGQGKRHAVALYVDRTGQKGYIDGWNTGIFPANYSWDEVISRIGQGYWKSE